MDAMTSQSPPNAANGAGESLDSWKAIAAYLKRDERTVRRWQDQGLPIHRHVHKKRASVYAYKSEIDAWWRTDRTRIEAAEAAAVAAAKTRHVPKWLLGAILALPVLLLALNAGGLRDQLLGRWSAMENASIAVLPLKNLSPDSQQDYFADGVTEALITQLGKISSLDVISHQSMLRYRGATKSLPEIAKELNVKAVVEGTVLHSGDRIRITANLVQAAPERHLWAESFEFEHRDILAVQERVAREVASHVHARLTATERQRLSTARPVDPGAYEAYLLGRAYSFKTPTAANLNRAKDYFEKAIERDPGYAAPYAGLAELYIIQRQWKGQHSDDRREARRWGEKALKLDNTLAEAHTVLARSAMQDWDWGGTERGFRRAIELNSSYALARLWYAMYLYGMLRFDEAVVEARRAQQLDPVSPYVNTFAGWAYFVAGRVDEGIASMQKALELDPSFSDASQQLARAYVALGKYPQAIAELRKGLAFNEQQPYLLGALAHAYARAGQRKQALQVISELQRIEAERPGYAPFGMIWAYAGIDDKERTFAYLEKAYHERVGRLVWLNTDPNLEPLRSDPRFADLVRRVGLPSRKEALAKK